MSGTRTTHRLSAVVALAFLISLFPLAPSAWAQVGDVADTAGDAAEGASDSVGDAVDDTVDTVNDTVDDTTDTVDEATGGATEPVGDAIDDTTDKVDETVDETTEDVKKTVGSTTDGVRDSLNDGVDKVRDEITPITSIVAGVTTHRSTKIKPGTRKQNQARRSVEGFESNEAPVAGRKQDGRPNAIDPAGTTSSSSAEPSLFERLIEGAGQIVTTMAFPIALLLLVAAFLAIHGRMDRSDPKLALAPLDQEQEYLSFN